MASHNTSSYSFERCLQNAYKVNWRIEDLIGGKAFDPACRWLPVSLSAAASLSTGPDDAVLDADERRKLSHVEMASYAHLFAYVEAFIAPKVVELAGVHAADSGGVDARAAFDALTNFAAEEVKHMRLFREIRALVNTTIGFESRLLDDASDTARFVLSKSSGAVLLLTAVIEWFTQRHYQEAFRDDPGLDPFTKEIFRAHWQEECQHAQMDHLETLRVFAGLDEAQREAAVDDLIELVGAVDGLLQRQSAFDVANLEQYLGRTLGEPEHAAVGEAVLRAKRWTFLESGVTHPRFQELLLEVTTAEQQTRIAAALEPLLDGSLTA